MSYVSGDSHTRQCRFTDFTTFRCNCTSAVLWKNGYFFSRFFFHTALLAFVAHSQIAHVGRAAANEEFSTRILVRVP